MNTILLIENNVTIIENFKEYLEMEGFTILTANKGSLGVKIARECAPDLIISAILLDEMNGYEVLRLLLNNVNTAEIPFIFSTTKCEKTDLALALKLGADDYIVKPFNMELLTEMAKKWIGSGRKKYN